MKFYLNPERLFNCFPLPTDIVDKHLKLASATQLKVLLFAIKNSDFDTKKIAAALEINAESVNDAFMYWKNAGVVLSNDTEPKAVSEKAKIKQKKAEIKRTVRAAAIKPDRNEVARRGLESEEIAFLLQEAQLKCGRALKQNEASTLVWLYDDLEMDISLILMILEFAASEGKFSISFIEKTAIEWMDDGVHTISDAERKLVELAEKKSAWNIICKTYGIERRMPSTTELKYAHTWINSWKFSAQMLKAAYDICVDATGKMALAYINKILTGWHKEKITTLEDIENSKKPNKPQAKNISYDIDSIESKMLSE